MIKRVALVLLAVLCLVGQGPVDLRAQNGLVFDFAMGYKGVSGDLGQILDGGVVGEFAFSYQANAFRYGIAINLVSIDIVEPFDSLSVSQVLASGLVTWMILPPESSLQPYGEFRLGIVRYRPEGEAFGEPPGEGENPGDSVNGLEIMGVVGLEYFFTEKVGLDISGAFSFITTDEIDLSAIGLEPIGKGTAWSARLGVVWRP